MTHEFQGESYLETINGPTIEETITGVEWDGYPLEIFSIASLLTQTGIVNYVWPYEGKITTHGNWRFHKGKVVDGDTEVDAPTKPLLVDAMSARAFKLVWEAINDKNKAKTTELCQSRGLFCWTMDKLVWPNVGFGGRT